ncbi:MAG: hypothetical protein ACE5K4_03120 [Candidatus Hydrothermarchaeota archaeon]
MKKMEIIKLRELKTREKESRRLYTLPPEFYRLAMEYIKNLSDEYSKRIKEGNLTVETEMLEDELRNAKKIIKDIYEQRERKILFKALADVRGGVEESDVSSMTPEEKEIYREIVKNLKIHRRKIFEGYTKPEEIKEESSEKDLKEENENLSAIPKVAIRVLEYIPQIVGIDGKTYGEFKPEDIAILPLSNAEPLIKRGLAEEIKLR